MSNNITADDIRKAALELIKKITMNQQVTVLTKAEEMMLLNTIKTQTIIGYINGVCVLGYGCKLGNDCELGNGCTLGEYIDARATFEGGRVQDGLYVQIGNIGSEHRTAYFYVDKDGAIFVRAGCWFGKLNDFKVRVKSVHGGTIYEAQYMAACAYAEAVLPLMLKESDAAREEQQHDNQ